MEACVGLHIQIHIFLSSAQVGGGWLASCSGRFIPRSHWTRICVSQKTCLDDLEKLKFLTLLGLELLPLGGVARSQSLCRLPLLLSVVGSKHTGLNKTRTSRQLCWCSGVEFILAEKHNSKQTPKIEGYHFWPMWLMWLMWLVGTCA
jgi:hypothetical protein